MRRGGKGPSGRKAQGNISRKANGGAFRAFVKRKTLCRPVKWRMGRRGYRPGVSRRCSEECGPEICRWKVPPPSRRLHIKSPQESKGPRPATLGRRRQVRHQIRPSVVFTEKGITQRRIRRCGRLSMAGVGNIARESERQGVEHAQEENSITV